MSRIETAGFFFWPPSFVGIVKPFFATSASASRIVDNVSQRSWKLRTVVVVNKPSAATRGANIFHSARAARDNIFGGFNASINKRSPDGAGFIFLSGRAVPDNSL